ncbi:MAG: ATP-dependent endonuclease [Actinobacteria bacterium]|nr:ATP-dependent endonuclease [Actinomycetota bacterium]
MTESLTTAILVEGSSDKNAVETLAPLLGHDLDAHGVVVVAIGGASKIGHALDAHGPRGSGHRLAGLCDLGEETAFRGALSRVWGPVETREDMEDLGFFVCVLDLEDELIRALGVDRVLEVVESERELGTFRSFQNQPAWRERPLPDQLRRFMGTFSGRKIRYASLLAETLEVDEIPSPLRCLLAHVVGG